MRTDFKSRVRFSEVDADCKLSFGKIIDYLQDCSNLQSEMLGVGVEHQEETNKAWILSSWQVEVKGEIKNGYNIEVATWPYSFNRACGKRNYTIAMADSPKDYIIEADSVWVLLNIDTGMLTKVEDSDTEKYELEEPLNMNYSKKKIAKASEYERKEEHIVYNYHLDINRHMNNSWYVKIAEEYIEDKSKIKSFRVEYKKSAKLGNKVIPFVAYENGRYVIELRNEENEVYAITEFNEN
jgi:medium-chain acyl-[acyl-carrier-protein] hydrolase